MRRLPNIWSLIFKSVEEQLSSFYSTVSSSIVYNVLVNFMSDKPGMALVSSLPKYFIQEVVLFYTPTL